MVRITIVIAVLLLLLGIVFYISSGMESITALIPSFLGLPLLILGILARNENVRKHLMHAAILLGLLGFLGALRGIPDAVQVLLGNTVPRPLAAVEQGLMALICGYYVAMGIRSFVIARRNQS